MLYTELKQKLVDWVNSKDQPVHLEWRTGISLDVRITINILINKIDEIISKGLKKNRKEADRIKITLEEIVEGINIGTHDLSHYGYKK